MKTETTGGDRTVRAPAALLDGGLPTGRSAPRSALAARQALPLAAALVGVIVLGFLTTPHFASGANLQNIVTAISVSGVLAVGQTFVILTGGIDLSVASILALSAVLAGTLAPGNLLLFVLLALAVGIAVGLLNGLLTVLGRIPAFIVTLATMSAASGLAFVVTNGNPVYITSQTYIELSTASIAGIPLVGIIFAVAALIGGFALRSLPLGRYVYAVGDNEEAARVAGLRVGAVKITVFVISGALAAVASVIDTSFTGVAQPGAGTGLELDAIAIVVLGGTNLFGGRGTMTGTFLGALVIGTLRDIFNLLGLSTPYQDIMMGAAIVIALLLQRSRQHS
ncbi:MAG TPA: ABC transporter permease [Pseudonocardiaceae bacterium]|nr:ABC transporter permease [Pseudonocardiaceae bacterium]